MMKVSLIVPSYNGRGKLPGLLKSLESQSEPNFEVLVVLDGSTDGSKAFLDSYQSEKFNLIVIEQENKGRAGVRNRGAFEASAELLVFYDDDMRPESASLKKHIDFHDRHPGTVYGGNQLENPDDAVTDFDHYRCYLRSKWLQPYQELRALNLDDIYLTAANFSIPKKLFHQLGGFNENMRDHEDRDLAERALKESIEVFFDPENVAWHDDFVSVEAYIQRRREYHRQFIEQGDKFYQSPIKRFFYYLFAQTIWIGVIEKGWLRFLPRKMRYRLYDLVIWGLAIYYPNKSLKA